MAKIGSLSRIEKAISASSRLVWFERDDRVGAGLGDVLEAGDVEAIDEAEDDSREVAQRVRRQDEEDPRRRQDAEDAKQQEDLRGREADRLQNADRDRAKHHEHGG